MDKFVYSESFYNHIVIQEILYNSDGCNHYVRFYRIDGNTVSKDCFAKLQITKKGRTFFISRGKRIFLENFLKNC